MSILNFKCNKIPFFDHFKFLSKISIDMDTNCWTWKGEVSKIHGYGRFYVNKKQYVSHRGSYDLFCNIKSLENVIDHVCMNKKCVNPDHLREVSIRTNTLENSRCPSVEKLNKKKCVAGHSLSDESNLIITYGKLGGARRNCRECKRISQRKWYYRSKK